MAKPKKDPSKPKPVKTQKQIAAEFKRKVPQGGPNPLTGQPANSFTKAYRVEPDKSASVIRDGVTQDHRSVLATPQAIQQKDPSPQRRSRQIKHTKMANNSVDSPMDAPLGYRLVNPEHAASMTPEQTSLVGWLYGAHHVFKGNPTGPAINEPHEASDDIHIPRRLEDLSGVEYNHAIQTLRDYGHRTNDTLGSVTETQTRNTLRALGEHAAAGTQESASQLFYGGEPTTHIHDTSLAELHRSKMMETQNRFNESVSSVQRSSQFQESTSRKPEEEAGAVARSVAANSTTRTSPNTKWRHRDTWPNMRAGDEATSAALEGRKPDLSKVSGSRPANVDLAVQEASLMVHEGVPRAAIGKRDSTPSDHPAATQPKTRDFGNALISHDSPESRAVSDVMEGHQISPSLSTVKTTVYEKLNADGSRATEPHPNTGKTRNVARVSVLPGKKAPSGYTVSMKADETTGKLKPEKGNSEVEAMLASGKSTVHAANDYATRKVNADLGVSRGVNYSDNVNQAQALRWGSEQQSRKDISHVNSATQYPVIRDWQAEGATLTGDRPKHATGHQFDWMYDKKSTEPQWAENPNTSGSSGDPLRTKPYLKMPGE